MEKLSFYNQNIEFVTSNKTDFIDPDGFSKIPKMQNPPPPPPKTKEGIEWERYHNEYRRLNDAEKVKWKVVESIFKWIAFAIAFSFFCMTVN